MEVFERAKNYLNTNNPFAHLLGMQITEVGDGTSTVVLPFRKDLSNPTQSANGGVQYSMADFAGGAAAVSHGRLVVTVDASFHYLRAGLDSQTLYARARELKAGKKLLTYEVTVSDQTGLVLSTGIFTFAPIRDLP